MQLAVVVVVVVVVAVAVAAAAAAVAVVNISISFSDTHTQIFRNQSLHRYLSTESVMLEMEQEAAAFKNTHHKNSSGFTFLNAPLIGHYKEGERPHTLCGCEPKCT